MASITLKDIPAPVHRALKRRAERNGRSLNREVIALLQQSVAPHRVSPGDLLAQIRLHRQGLPGRLDEELLDEASETGRP